MSAMNALTPPDSALIYVSMPTYHTFMRANTNCCNASIPASSSSRPVLSVSVSALFTTQTPATDA